MRNWRAMTWVLIGWCALMIIWIVVSANSSDCENEEFTDLCEAGTSLGVGFIIFFGLAGFALLTIVWFATRPREVRIINAGPPAGQFPGPANRPPPPPAAPQSAGWYPDPAGRFQYRWFDGVWTDRVANGGDGQTSVDPLQPG